MKSVLLATISFLFAMTVLTGCDRDGTLDPIVDDLVDPANVVVTPKVATPPSIDGDGTDAAWDQATSTFISTSVADIPAFAGYGGRNYQIQFKAVYDDNNIYFLAKYNDATLDADRETWYFDSDSDSWVQESRWPQFDDDGNLVRMGFYEDKLSLIWEASPVEGFSTSGCGVACHVGLSPFQNDAGKTALKYTNNFGEILDMWHLKYVRSAGTSIPTMDDQYTDWTSTARNGGRHSDPGVNSYVNNKQTIDGKSVPLYVLDNPSGPYFWISPDDISSGNAVTVTDVDDDGNLSLSNGGAVSSSDANYQRDGAFRPPSVYTRVPDGDRANIIAKAVYDGGFWTIEIQRSLITGSDLDVQFDNMTKDYPFGIAVFDNAAIAHGSSTEPFFIRFSN